MIGMELFDEDFRSITKEEAFDLIWSDQSVYSRELDTSGTAIWKHRSVRAASFPHHSSNEKHLKLLEECYRIYKEANP